MRSSLLTFLATIGLVSLASAAIALIVYSITEMYAQEEQPPFSIEFPSDDSQVEIHCEIITPV